MQTQTFNSTSADETLRFGRKLAGFLRAGMTLAVYGELGSGKSVLARGIARGLGIEEPVTSPTFAVVQEYRTKDNGWFYHLDMYRITGEEDAVAFGIDDYLFPPDGISFVEWPERIEDLLHMGETQARDLLSIYIEHINPEEREIAIHSPGRQPRQ